MIKASQIGFNEGILRLALIHDREVEFRYEKDASKPIETRRFKPESVNQAKDGDHSFAGYDSDRGALRQFRVDRIKGDVKVVG